MMTDWFRAVRFRRRSIPRGVRSRDVFQHRVPFKREQHLNRVVDDERQHPHHDTHHQGDYRFRERQAGVAVYVLSTARTSSSRA